MASSWFKLFKAQTPLFKSNSGKIYSGAKIPRVTKGPLVHSCNTSHILFSKIHVFIIDP